ncbi:MAG: DUF1616 domain-containing protein [Candidatus Brockarchaeota archaeon]|nr:DUF1616 domain-containing protein [Candidatus Brockarchaeota archaeon]
MSSVLLLVLLADLAILSPSSSEEPLAFFRVALSLLLIAFLPGFCAVRLLYPKGGLEGMEVIGYSVMISLFVSPSVALLMGALPTGFGTVENPAPLLFALSTVTAIMAVAAFVRCGKS